MDLPYELNALEPALSEKILTLHYQRHHKGYVDKLNELISQNPSYFGLDLEEVAKKSYYEQHWPIFNNSAQIIAHDFYWKSLTSFSERNFWGLGVLSQQMEKTFGTFENFIEQCVHQGVAQFGSGWMWLICNEEKNTLEIVTTSNAYLPWIEFPKKRPLLTVDLWEHAYYVDYYNQRKDYLEKVLRCLDWSFAEKQYKNL